MLLVWESKIAIFDLQFGFYGLGVVCEGRFGPGSGFCGLIWSWDVRFVLKWRAELNLFSNGGRLPVLTDSACCFGVYGSGSLYKNGFEIGFFILVHKYKCSS